MTKSSRVATITRLKHVAAELVGAEPVRGRRGLAAPAAVLLASGS